MARPKKARPVSVKIYEGSDGLWHGYLTVGTKPNGRPDRRHRTGHTQAECEQKIRQLEDEHAAGKTPTVGRPPTVEQWLRHWCENIARPHVSWSTYQNTYRYAVYHYLIPNVGGHRLDGLEADHLEKLYQRLLGTDRKPGLSPGTVALIHRTVHAALEEAVRRGKVGINVAKIAKSVAPDPPDIDPLTIDECKKILAVTAKRRNGARWSIAMLGPRQGEVLALIWDEDVDLDAEILVVRGKAQRRKWLHGCDDPTACARWKHGCKDQTACASTADRCPGREVRCREKPCPPAWGHGCPDPEQCKAKQGRACRRRQAAHCPRHRGECPPPCRPGCTEHAATCPKRHSGGIVRTEQGSGPGTSRRRLRTKSKAGGRRLGLPPEIVAELRAHRVAQDAERKHAGSLWEDNGLVFCGQTGKPIDPSRDREEWKSILAEAGVRDVTGHQARHAAATLLLLKGVDRRVVMDIMCWSSERMLSRYQHVVDEMRTEAAKRLGGALFGGTATDHATGPDHATEKETPRPALRLVRGGA
jgi:integrase